MSRLISYAQNGEDVRVWRAFQALVPPVPPGHFTYIDVGANHPFELSITASLYSLGWRGLLIEADPEFASELRRYRPMDQVLEVAASDREGEITFYQVFGTGLGTTSADEAGAARAAGFEVGEFTAKTATLNSILRNYFDRDSFGGDSTDIHFMSIDVEGAEPLVLAGLDLSAYRPWVFCIEAIDAETKEPNHFAWESRLLENDYLDVAFDGINRWYVAKEHAELAAAIATPLNPIDTGKYGWIRSEHAGSEHLANKSYNRVAWQRALLLNRASEIESAQQRDAQLVQLSQQLQGVQNSRAHRIAQPIDRVLRKTKATLIGVSRKMPAPVRNWTVRKRHLRIVNPALEVYTDPAFLRNVPESPAVWVNPELKPEVPIDGCGLLPLTSDQVESVSHWLASGPFDTDALLESRTDGLNDELGRTMAALRARIALSGASLSGGSDSPVGNKVLFDARSLQTPTFGARGIGRFALAALRSAQESTALSGSSAGQLVLLIDPSLNQLPPELVGNCDQITKVTQDNVGEFGLFIQPSPMTASVSPIIEILRSGAQKLAIVFDFIPMHYPSLYLRHVASRVEYAAALDALRLYTEFLCISQLTRKELERVLADRGVARGSYRSQVAWPQAIEVADRGATASNSSGPILVMTGDESRKNTFGALAAIGVATCTDDSREIFVLGMAHRPDHVHHLSIAAAVRPGEARALGHLSDADMHALIESASVVVVPSLDEGLSLPLLEAASAGTPIVASDIPAHRELIGSGSYLADPSDLSGFARAITKHRGKSGTAARQRRSLLSHDHVSLESAIAASVGAVSGVAAVPAADNLNASGAVPSVTPRRLNIGFATPWSPQKSGVADFSTVIGHELAKIADLTLYVTADANPLADMPEGVECVVRPVDVLFAQGGKHDHDVLVSVVGNSHFHLPFIQLTQVAECVVVAHDTRMNEFYAALRGVGGLQELMLRTVDPSAPKSITPALDDQIADMRLLQNAAMWEVVRNAKKFIFHSPSAQARIARETGITPEVLTFPNYRDPAFDNITPDLRRSAKSRLGFAPDRIHLTSLGFIDTRTKMSDVVIESAAWLQQWGHPVSLHLAGAASEIEHAQLIAQAEHAGLVDFEIPGFLTEEDFRDYLLATDIGIQLRISSLLGVSGPLGDLAGYGVESVASSGLVRDVDAPAFVHPLPEYVSPVMVAQEVEKIIRHPVSDSDREHLRVEYLRTHSPSKYAQEFLGLLQEVK